MNSFFIVKNELYKPFYKDKGSKFIVFALPVNTVEEVLNRVKDKRKEFFRCSCCIALYHQEKKDKTFLYAPKRKFVQDKIFFV